MKQCKWLFVVVLIVLAVWISGCAQERLEGRDWPEPRTSSPSQQVEK